MSFQRISAFLALLAIGSSINVIAQTPSSGLPQDPMALMSLARDRNGLSGSEIKPWHIRGTYRSFDMKGNPEYEGTYEEWWVSATRYKLSLNNPKSTQTDYATGTVLLRDGSPEWQSGLELLMRASLLQPLPDVSQLKEFTYSVEPKLLADPQSNVSASHILWVRTSRFRATTILPLVSSRPNRC